MSSEPPQPEASGDTAEALESLAADLVGDEQEPFDEPPSDGESVSTDGKKRKSKKEMRTNQVEDMADLASEDEDMSTDVSSLPQKGKGALNPPAAAGMPGQHNQVRDDVEGEEEDMPMDERMDYQKRIAAICDDGTAAEGGADLCEYTMKYMADPLS